jgi:hypothetical protein
MIYNAIEKRYPNEGSWSFAVALVITTVGALGFYYLYRKLIKAELGHEV